VLLVAGMKLRDEKLFAVVTGEVALVLVGKGSGVIQAVAMVGSLGLLVAESAMGVSVVEEAHFCTSDYSATSSYSMRSPN